MSKTNNGINDEFYTPAESIINELKWYGYDGEFKGKTIYLPCDYDATLPYLKKEVKNIKSVDGFIEFNDEVTIYKVMPELFTENDKNNAPRNCQFVAYLTEHKEDFGIKDIYISGYDAITGEGLRFQDAPFNQFDVIITNPPFSQMNDWINKIIDFSKRGGEFIFLAPLSILTNTFAFPHFKNLDFWCGYTEPSKYEDAEGNKMPQYLPSVWLTNFDVKKHKPKRVLSKSWEHHPDEYMPFWNYRAINVQSVNDIPYDYADEFAVPATMLKDLHLDQFEIIGLGQGKDQFKSLPGWIDRSDWTFQMYLDYADTPKTAHSFDVSSLLITSKDLDKPYKAPFCKVILKNKELIDGREYFYYSDVLKFVKKELETKSPDEIWHPKLFKTRGNQKAKQGKGGTKNE
ncbi:MAG: adenine-specific methyltransferase EcoRI family protein [Acholeplasma sp.]|nr:adenine-specific methyltransferase EcoRI family protein [Acholeplasma sp.]